jgi:hypothetical protein
MVFGVVRASAGRAPGQKLPESQKFMEPSGPTGIIHGKVDGLEYLLVAASYSFGIVHFYPRLKSPAENDEECASDQIQ